MRVRPRVPESGTIQRRLSGSFLPSFCHRLTAMTRVAERLQVTAIREERPIPTVGHDVVHVRGPHSSALLGTGPAIGLTQELVWAEIVRPLRRSIQTVPCGAVGAALIFGLVGSTVAVRHQDAASWMPAWSQRLPAHGLSPPGKQKTPETMATLALGNIMGSGVQRSGLALCAG